MSSKILKRLLSPTTKTSRSFATRESRNRPPGIVLGGVAVCATAVGGGVLALWKTNLNPHVSAKSVEMSPPRQQPSSVSANSARFDAFASVEWDGRVFMTPRDFLDSVVNEEPRPRVKTKLLTKRELRNFLSRVPRTTETEDQDKLFRELADHGVISYTEYLFLLSILTKPKSGFRVAFDLMDTSKENTILRSEFYKFCLMAARQKLPDRLEEEDSESTLTTHLFGIKGKHELSFDEFTSFVNAFQKEVLQTEFYEYSRGLDFITEEDFARILLRYMGLSAEVFDSYLLRLSNRLPETSPGITFDEFYQFSMLLNNIEDFEIAAKFYELSGKPMTEKDFNRAAKICLGGKELSQNVINTVFWLFDKDDDSCLSTEEFCSVLRSRRNRRLRATFRSGGWDSFKSCVREQMRTGRARTDPI